MKPSFKNIDNILEKIQERLANATRPLDYLTHKLTVSGTKLKTEFIVTFLNDMRIEIADIATSVTQARINNMDYAVGTTARIPRIDQEQNGTLVEDEGFE
ncbi:hypothetical protein AYI70_g9506, partial [Smittium culicis]